MVSFFDKTMHACRGIHVVRTAAGSGAVRRAASASAQAPQPLRNLPDYVYGDAPLEVRAQDPGFAGAAGGEVKWENLDGRRIEDGRYAAFCSAIVASGIPQERLYTDALRTHAYGTDASFYRLNPKAVVKVETEEEVVNVLHAAREHHTPVTFRAAGTSLSGQAITDSVLVKISHAGKNWRRFRIEEDGEVVVLEPGLIGGEVNSLLAAYARRRNLPQRKLGPDPASIDSCMVGGIFNNNSSGMCCGVAQNTYHTVRDCRVVFVDGTVLDTACADSRAAFEASHPHVLASLTSLAARVQADEGLSATIRRKFAIKCTTGYSINALVDFKPSDPFEILKHILVGSEGTLAFLSEVVYATVPEHPHRASAFMMFASVDAACDATKVLKETGRVNAAELFDRASLAQGEGDQAFCDGVHGVRGCAPGCAGVLVEVRAASPAALEADIAAIWEALEVAGTPFLETEARNEFVADPRVFNAFWNMRKGLIPKVGAQRKGGSVMLIEDVACPIGKLADMTLDLIEMFKRHSYHDACIFGHALDGNLHLVFSQSFEESADVDQFDGMMRDMAHIVAEVHGGSLKGEHGTGRNVAAFVELEWGRRAYEAMEEIKAIFDPVGLLNPGVLLNTDPEVHIKALKLLPPADPIVDKCIECGFCESNCPSKDLSLTPRQRIATFREISRLKTEVAAAPAASTPSALYKADRLREMEAGYTYYGEETCAADGMCQEKCPVSINTGSLIKKLRADDARGIRNSRAALAAARNFSAFAALVRVALGAAGLARRVVGDGFLRSASLFLKRSNFLYLAKAVPVWSAFVPGASTLTGERLGDAPAAADKRVVLMPSCVNRIMQGADGNSSETLATVMRRAGYTVLVPDAVSSLCCGMMFSSRGCATAADLKQTEAFEALRALSGDFSLPVVCETSPCAKQLQEAGCVVYDPVQFLHLASKHLSFTKVHPKITLHVPCSSKKLGSTASFEHLAALCADEVVPSGIPCCGTAGDRGLRFPELPGSSLQHLPKEASDPSVPAYSTSLTCEVGLSNVTHRQWGSLLTLIEQATRVPAS